MTSVRVGITSFTHSFPDDLDIWLRSPAGTCGQLFSDAGGSANVNNFSIVIRNFGVVGDIPDGGPIANGTPYSGRNYAAFDDVSTPAGCVDGALNLETAFDGQNPNGNWSLFVLDDTAGDSGQFNWNIDILTDRSPPPAKPDLVAASDTGQSSSDNVTNDNTPTFQTSKARGACTVRLFADPVGPGAPFQVATFGPTAFTAAQPINITSGALADGQYQFFADQQCNGDTAFSNTSLVSDVVTIDTNAPTTSTPDLDPSSDTGVSNSDNVTTDSTPTFNGNASEPARTQLFVNGAPNNQEGNASTAPYSITSSPLAPGTYNIQARSTDLAGNVGPLSGTLQVTIQQDTPCNRLGPATFTGTAGHDTFTGTALSERIEGRGGDDTLNGAGGADCVDGNADNDNLTGGSGQDEIRGGGGDDEINSIDNQVDRVDCGTGIDEVEADPGDIVAANCEFVEFGPVET